MTCLAAAVVRAGRPTMPPVPPSESVRATDLNPRRRDSRRRGAADKAVPPRRLATASAQLRPSPSLIQPDGPARHAIFCPMAGPQRRVDMTTRALAIGSALLATLVATSAGAESMDLSRD